MIKLYSASLSMFAKKVEIALAEKKLPYERILVPFNQTEGYAPRNPEVLRINPKRQVPVLIDEAVELYDSTLILEYLEDAYPDTSLLPRSAAAKASCRTFDLYADEIMLPSLKALMHRTEPWEDIPKRAALERQSEPAKAQLAQHFIHLEQELGSNECLCGDFTIADISVFLAVFYTQRLDGPELNATPQLEAWYKRLKSRPAFKAMIAEIQTADERISRPVPNARF